MSGEPDIGQVVDVAISVDGSWRKRYGHNSLNGIVFVISIDTGCVLDYVVKTKFCHACKSNPNATEEWKKSHQDVCCINHTRSSGMMEVEGSIEMFLQSVQKHKLRYTTYVGYGDSAFASVKKALIEKFGDQYPVEKEDCIGHIQKRMGMSLCNYKNKARGSKLEDGKGVGGAGRLTDPAIDRMQMYYGYAIRNNKGNLDRIRDAIWVIYHHMILG